MIIEHIFNLEESNAVYESCKADIKPKECYMNIFRVLQYFPEKFRNQEWRIAYGYIEILENHNLLARHCFLVNSKGEVIDPTLVGLDSFDETKMKKYISFKLFNDVDDYLDSITENDNLPDLVQCLLPVEREYANPWAKENDYILIG